MENIFICAVRSRPALSFPERLNSLRRAWEGTFRTGFLEFRSGLREISEFNRSRMSPGFHMVLSHPSRELESLSSRPGSVIFPTDDDDWFSGDAIARVAGTEFSGCVRWNYTQLMLGRFSTLGTTENWGNFFRYQCNNYCLETPCVPGMLDSHYPDLTGDLPCDETLLDMSLSVHNKTPASISHPRKGLDPGELVTQRDLCIENLRVLPRGEFSAETDMLLRLLMGLRTSRLHL